jgi:hypothetical protein
MVARPTPTEAPVMTTISGLRQGVAVDAENVCRVLRFLSLYSDASNISSGSKSAREAVPNSL